MEEEDEAWSTRRVRAEEEREEAPSVDRSMVFVSA
jgi:hypothetical protein